MRTLTTFFATCALISAAATCPAAPTTAPATKDYSTSTIVTRLMAFDKDGDGKLTSEELTDSRLHRLFDLADTEKTGVVTKDQLIALAQKLETEAAQNQSERRGPRGFGGPGGGPGGHGGPPPGGFHGGPGGPGGPDDGDRPDRGPR